MPTTIDWPSTLPQEFEQGSFREEREPASIVTPTESGVKRRRRRFTARPVIWSGEIFIEDATQYTTFWTFFDTTTAFGTLSFNWKHPITEAALEVNFTEEQPRTVTAGSSFYIRFGIEAVL